jgi:hypothetical protein
MDCKDLSELLLPTPPQRQGVKDISCLHHDAMHTIARAAGIGSRGACKALAQGYGTPSKFRPRNNNNSDQLLFPGTLYQLLSNPKITGVLTFIDLSMVPGALTEDAMELLVASNATLQGLILPWVFAWSLQDHPRGLAALTGLTALDISGLRPEPTWARSERAYTIFPAVGRLTKLKSLVLNDFKELWRYCTKPIMDRLAGGLETLVVLRTPAHDGARVPFREVGPHANQRGGLGNTGAHIARLTNLKLLHLCRGVVPDDDCCVVEWMSHLTYLQMNQACQLTFNPAMTKDLVELRLTAVDSMPSNVDVLSRLLTLHLEYHVAPAVTELRKLHDLTRLRDLRVDGRVLYARQLEELLGVFTGLTALVLPTACLDIAQASRLVHLHDLVVLEVRGMVGGSVRIEDDPRDTVWDLVSDDEPQHTEELDVTFMATLSKLQSLHVQWAPAHMSWHVVVGGLSDTLTSLTFPSMSDVETPGHWLEGDWVHPRRHISSDLVERCTLGFLTKLSCLERLSVSVPNHKVEWDELGETCPQITHLCIRGNMPDREEMRWTGWDNSFRLDAITPPMASRLKELDIMNLGHELPEFFFRHLTRMCSLERCSMLGVGWDSTTTYTGRGEQCVDFSPLNQLESLTKLEMGLANSPFNFKSLTSLLPCPPKLQELHILTPDLRWTMEVHNTINRTAGARFLWFTDVRLADRNPVGVAVGDAGSALHSARRCCD